MNIRLFTLLIIIGFTSCDSPYNHSPGDSAEADLLKQEVFLKETKDFTAFSESLVSSPIHEPSSEVQINAMKYFPDSTIHKGHQLHARPIPFGKSHHLIYYEYSIPETNEQNVYLGVYNQTGETIDLVNIKEVSFDGSVSINVVDDKILEIEYYDFYNPQQLYESDLITEVQSSKRKLPYRLKTSYQVKDGKGTTDYYFYESYALKADGKLKPLDHATEVIIDRQFPFASIKVLSYSELSNYTSEQCRSIINEIYASYGFIFRNEELIIKYHKQPWYKAKHANIDHLLSDVEKLNIKKLIKTERENQRSAQ